MYTHITFVLDSSGSMASIEDDTIGGFNSFLEEQRAEEMEATVSLYDFSTTTNIVYETRPISKAVELGKKNYTPSGRTALHDALTTAVTETAAYVQSLPQTEQPETVVVVVLTDGKENASETPEDYVRDLVTRYRTEHEWEFLFIGANQDAALTARSVGMDADHALDMTYNQEGVKSAYESTSRIVSKARREGSTDGYDDSDRRWQDNVRDD